MAAPATPVTSKGGYAGRFASPGRRREGPSGALVPGSVRAGRAFGPFPLVLFRARRPALGPGLRSKQRPEDLLAVCLAELWLQIEDGHERRDRADPDVARAHGVGGCRHVWSFLFQARALLLQSAKLSAGLEPRLVRVEERA